MSIGAETTRRGALDMQVCVPCAWTDNDVRDFANRDNPCGTQHGWQIRKQGGPLLAGCDERVQCQSRLDYVHITLDA